jgi:hypothetical protein
MKKLLIIVVLLCPLFIQAQSSSSSSSSSFPYKSEGKYFYYSDVVKVDTTLDVPDLYKDAQLYFKKLAIPTMKITTDDAKAGVIAADFDEKTSFKTETGIGSENLEVKYSLKIEMKKGRYRYTIDNIILSYIGADHKVNPHTLGELDKDKSGGPFGLGRSKRILTGMNNLFMDHISMMEKTLSKKSDDF